MVAPKRNRSNSVGSAKSPMVKRKKVGASSGKTSLKISNKEKTKALKQKKQSSSSVLAVAQKKKGKQHQTPPSSNPTLDKNKRIPPKKKSRTSEQEKTIAQRLNVYCPPSLDQETGSPQSLDDNDDDDDDDDVIIEEQDMDVIEQFGESIGFLENVDFDQVDLTRSKAKPSMAEKSAKKKAVIAAATAAAAAFTSTQKVSAHDEEESSKKMTKAISTNKEKEEEETEKSWEKLMSKKANMNEPSAILLNEEHQHHLQQEKRKERLPIISATTGHSVRDKDAISLSMPTSLLIKRLQERKEVEEEEEEEERVREQEQHSKDSRSNSSSSKINHDQLPFLLRPIKSDEEISSASEFEFELGRWKEEIATISLEILENPEQSLSSSLSHSTNGSFSFDSNSEAARFLGMADLLSQDSRSATEAPRKVRVHWGLAALLRLAEARSNRAKGQQLSCNIGRLCLLSLSQIFRDVLPGYRLQPELLGLPIDPFEKSSSKSKSNSKSSALAQKSSSESPMHKKEIQKRMDFERGLLSSYQRFLKILKTIQREGDIVRRGGTVYMSSRRASSKKSCPEFDEEQFHRLEKSSVRALTEISLFASNFTWSTQLLSLLVPYCAHKDREIAEKSSLSIKNILQEDMTGDCSLTIVKLVCGYVKSKSYNCPPQVLDSLLEIRITEDVRSVFNPEKERKQKDKIREDSQQQRKEQSKQEKMMSRNKRKQLTIQREVDKEMNEFNAEQNKSKLKELQAQMLRIVFAIYFRILKKSPDSILLPSVLRGISKYSYLISLDFQADLLKVLQNLISFAILDENGNDDEPDQENEQIREQDDELESHRRYDHLLERRESSFAHKHSRKTRKQILHVFQCALAAFKTQKAHANAIEVDMKSFFSAVYTQLLTLPVEEVWVPPSVRASSSLSAVLSAYASASSRFSSSSDALIANEDLLVAAIESFSTMINDNRSTPDIRAAAFAKRAMEVATSLGESGAVLAFLACAGQTLARFQSTRTLLESNPSESLTSEGNYMPFVSIPDWSHAFNSQMWELPSLLTHHYHPGVRTLASAILRGQYTQQNLPLDLLARHDTRSGGFNPPVAKPPPHPLQRQLIQLRKESKTDAGGITSENRDKEEEEEDDDDDDDDRLNDRPLVFLKPSMTARSSSFLGRMRKVKSKHFVCFPDFKVYYDSKVEKYPLLKKRMLRAENDHYLQLLQQLSK